ncbi:MAG: flagellar filament capping protein FliD [Peptococcia bacterium]
MINTNMRLSGLATGMDTENVIRDLMKIERFPLDKKLKEKQIWEWRRDDYRSLNTRLLALKNKAFDMTLNTNYLVKRATSTNESVATASASGSALNGVYNLKVLQLAEAATNTSSQAISLSSDDKIDPSKSLYYLKDMFADSSFFDGVTADDSFDVTINGKTLTFSYGDGLNKILNTINSDKDLKVSIFYDSGTDRIAMTSKVTGEDAELHVEGAFFTDLLKIDNSTKVAGKNAEFILNGLATNRSSNNFTINGVTFNLKGVTPGGVDGVATSIDIQTDTDTIVNNIKAFVDLYNEVLTALDSKITEPRYRDYQPLTSEEKDAMKEADIEKWEEKARSGLLRSDSIIEGILTDMRRIVAETVGGIDGLKSLNEIGISAGAYLTNKTRTLTIDERKLREAIEKDPEAVAKIFNNESEIDSEKGLMIRLNEKITAGINKITNRAGNSTTGYDQSVISKTIRNIDDYITRMEERLMKVEENYWRRFTAMERAISTMNSQSAWLSAQFAGLGAN